MLERMLMMKRQMVLLLAAALLFSGCAKSAPQEESAPMAAVEQELGETAWQAVSTDAEAFDLTDGLGNQNFRDVFEHIDTVPLDQLIAFSLVADGGPSEGAEDELRSRFLQSTHTVLAYLVLMGDQSAPHAQDLTAAEDVCRRIASADAAWYGGTEEFAKTMETCRAAYPSGPAAHLLDTLEAEQKASLERNG